MLYFCKKSQFDVFWFIASVAPLVYYRHGPQILVSGFGLQKLRWICVHYFCFLVSLLHDMTTFSVMSGCHLFPILPKSHVRPLAHNDLAPNLDICSFSILLQMVAKSHSTWLWLATTDFTIVKFSFLANLEPFVWSVNGTLFCSVRFIKFGSPALVELGTGSYPLFILISVSS